MKRGAVVRLALVVTPLLSGGCNAILGIEEHKLGPPADAASDAGAADPDGRVVDSGSPVLPDGSVDAIGPDVYAPDRRDTDTREGGSSGPDAADAGATAPDARDAADPGADGGDSGSIGDGGSTGDSGSTDDGGPGDSGRVGGDAGDAVPRIVVLRGTISST